jgi:hypothetical protein
LALEPRFRGGDERSTSFRVSGDKAGITHKGVDHLMIYDAPSSLPGQALRICRTTASRIWPWCRAAGRAPSSPSATPPRHPWNGPQGRPPVGPPQHQWRRPFLHASRYVRTAGDHAPDARRRPRPRPNPRRQDLGCGVMGGMFAASGTIVMSNALQMADLRVSRKWAGKTRAPPSGCRAPSRTRSTRG